MIFDGLLGECSLTQLFSAVFPHQQRGHKKKKITVGVSVVVKNLNFRKKNHRTKPPEILVHLRNTETQNKKLCSRLFQFARMLFIDFAYKAK